MATNQLTADQYKRLPRYAREEIARLNREVVRLENQLDTYRGQIDHPFAYLPGGVNDAPLPIAGSKIFRQIILSDDPDRPSSQWSVTLNDDSSLEIRARWGETLSVQPMVSNVIRVVGI